VLPPFEDLGAAIEKAWDECGRKENAFGEIATKALIASEVLTKVTPEDIIDWIVNSDHLPTQDASDFGQPPVNLYVNQDFYIQALFWIDATTSIHEHAFSGAFGVLQGSSVHSTYSFTPKKVASKRVVIGETRFIQAELLQQGDVRTIFSGNGLIHALFHLDRPSVSLVVRTRAEAEGDRPQYAYLKPFLAFHDKNLPKQQMIQLRMLESLFAVDRKAFWLTAANLVAKCDPFVLCEVLGTAHRNVDDSKNWDALLSSIAAENQDLVQYIVPCLKEGDRINRLLALRTMIHNPVHRFFIALLLNVPDRNQIYKLVVQRFPASDPKTLILQWLGEIFGEERAGIRINPSALFLIDRMLEDPNFDSSKSLLREHFAASPDINEATLSSAWSQIQNVDVLRPLLTTSAIM